MRSAPPSTSSPSDLKTRFFENREFYILSYFSRHKIPPVLSARSLFQKKKDVIYRGSLFSPVADVRTILPLSSDGTYRLRRPSNFGEVRGTVGSVRGPNDICHRERDIGSARSSRREGRRECRNSLAGGLIVKSRAKIAGPEDRTLPVEDSREDKGRIADCASQT